ncbi:AbrB family transcriptional regulator [Halomonas sp. HP20-15]|uniref:AbrB family transcriptional regulator n=1 Tax=Halomonas sp. HP20-15 TaxID=3085901 RepID=UPI00298127F2|nr:AbrB family transcriptional regulator [Halomonas sp. HP20-15]MDW5378035.1 AbrB family transcriptional regulator [Halomonas sp. HP20-15]
MSKGHVFTALVIAAAAATGHAANLAGIPLPWILGPMLVSAVAALSGLGVPESLTVRRGAQVVVGTSVGHGFTAAVLLSLAWQVPWMVLFALWSLCIAAVCSLLLARWGGLDRRTALLANLPGGVAEMAFLGDDSQSRGASTAISLIQAMRVTSLVILLPLLLSLFLDGSGGAGTAAGGAELGAETLLILAIGFAAGWCMNRVGIQNAFIVGALLVSVVDTLTGALGGRVPQWLFIVAQIAIGLTLGARFKREEIARLPRILAVGLGVSLITSTLIILSAWSIASPLDIPLSIMTLAGSPGGIAEMMITATSLGLGVAEVVAFQMVRIIVVNLSASPVARLWLRVTS